MAQQPSETDPGVIHVAWEIDGIYKLFQDPTIKGNELRGNGPHTSPFVYKTVPIEPSSSHRIYFQLA